MAEFLPLFPLSLIVFPGEDLRLHIFEPRYRQLIRESIEGKTTFGIPVVIDKTVAKIATEVRVVSIDKRYSEGRMDITTRGLRRARVLEFYHEAPEKPYPGGEIEWLETDEQTDPRLQQHVFELLESLHDALGISKRFAEDFSGIHSFQLGHHIGMTLKKEFELLALDKEIERLRAIENHLEEILPVVMETERLKAKAKLNGHYKNVIPPDF